MLSCAVLVALPVLAAAQAPAPFSGSPDLPRPAAAAGRPRLKAKKLDFPAGDWIHAENYCRGRWDPAARAGAGPRCPWILGNHDLLVTYVTKAPVGTIEGRGLGGDTDKNAYRMDWFDTKGDASVSAPRECSR
jgi:hypothetical protein